jgi:hypothetical protein
MSRGTECESQYLRYNTAIPREFELDDSCIKFIAHSRLFVDSGAFSLQAPVLSIRVESCPHRHSGVDTVQVVRVTALLSPCFFSFASNFEIVFTSSLSVSGAHSASDSSSHHYGRGALIRQKCQFLQLQARKQDLLSIYGTSGDHPPLLVAHIS